MLPQIVDISALTDKKISGPVTSWQVRDGPYNVEHLAGMGTNGDLLVFYWSPRQDWTAVNVTQITGQKISGPVTSWQVRDGPMIVEYLAGKSQDGSLLIFWWSPAHDWQSLNISSLTGKKIKSSVLNWRAGTAEHLAGQGEDNSLLVFWSTTPPNWQAVNVSQITGEFIGGVPRHIKFQKREKPQNCYQQGDLIIPFSYFGTGHPWIGSLLMSLK